MAAYETYKDSGVKWLGTIPSHWEVDKIRYFFDEITELNLNRQSSNQLQFKFGTIIPKSDLSVDENVWQTISKYTVVKPDDIIINGLNLNYDLLSHRVGRVRENGVITSAYVHIRPHEDICAKYYEYLFKAMDAQKVFHGFGTGVRATLSYKELRQKPIAIPPIAEQEAIVAYLDKATGEIDRAIEVQQQMIDALNERIQIIISRAVTKGLNLDAKIGKDGFPAHWEVFPLRYAMSIRNGYTPSKANPAFWENGTIPWYRMEDIRKSGRMLNEAIQCVTPKAVKSAGTFDAGSFILAICTASIGEHAMLIADSLANQQFANLKIRKSLSARINPMFMFYYMYVIGDFCRNNANSTCFQYVDMSGLKRFPVPIPRHEEQEAIVDYLNTNTAGIKQQIANCQRMIDLLTERKQIIINQVVTGKEKVI